MVIYTPRPLRKSSTLTNGTNFLSIAQTDGLPIGRKINKFKMIFYLGRTTGIIECYIRLGGVYYYLESMIPEYDRQMFVVKHNYPITLDTGDLIGMTVRNGIAGDVCEKILWLEVEEVY